MSIINEIKKGPLVIRGIEKLRKNLMSQMSCRTALEFTFLKDKNHFKCVNNQVITSREFDINNQILLHTKLFIENLNAILKEV